MKIQFVDHLPARAGAVSIDKQAAAELIDALLDNPNEWAKIAYTDLYPQHRGEDNEKQIYRIRNFTSRVRKGQQPFDEYSFDCTSKSTDVYIRVLADVKALRGIA